MDSLCIMLTPEALQCQEVHSNKELCDLLATRITQTLDILHTQMAEFEGDSVDYIPAPIVKSVQQLTRSDIHPRFHIKKPNHISISNAPEISTVFYHI